MVKCFKKFNPLLDSDAIQAPKKIKPHVKSYSVYIPEEFDRFFSVIADKEDQFLFLLLFRYGLRISECLGLMWSDFKADDVHIDRCACVKNDEKGVIFTIPKTVNSIRVYPILKEFPPTSRSLGQRKVIPATSSPRNKRARSSKGRAPSEGRPRCTPRKPGSRSSSYTNSATPAFPISSPAVYPSGSSPVGWATPKGWSRTPIRTYCRVKRTSSRISSMG